MIKKIASFFILVCICTGAAKGVYYAKGGFSPRRIHSLNFWVQEDLSDEAKEILKQPFHYLGRGRQCFAFASEDGKYVLKLPRTDIYQTPFWLKAFSFPSHRKKLEAQHKARETFILTSFRLSLNELKEQTGLIALHLGKSFSDETLILKDKLGLKHRLNLGKTSFALQYKQPILMKEFTKALETNNLEEAKKILDALLDVIIKRARRGILNKDRSFLKNYGFDGNLAYQIDVGSFFKDPNLPPKQAYEKSIRDSIDPIQEWLSQNSLEMLDYLNLALAHSLADFSD